LVFDGPEKLLFGIIQHKLGSQIQDCQLQTGKFRLPDWMEVGNIRAGCRKYF